MSFLSPATLAPLGRRGFLKLTGAAGLGALALSQLPTLAALAADDESVADIVNVAATAEAMAVTLTGAVLTGASGYDGGKGLPEMLVRWVRAIQAEEQAHYAFLSAAGAKPLTTTFTVPQSLAPITNDSKALLTFVVGAETIFIAAYTAAADRFAQLKQPQLAQVALQIAGVEAEHRVLANAGLGASPPNNVAFEKALFNSVGEAAAAVKGLGLLGTPSPTPRPSTATCAEKVDNTASATLPRTHREETPCRTVDTECSKRPTRPIGRRHRQHRRDRQAMAVRSSAPRSPGQPATRREGAGRRFGADPQAAQAAEQATTRS